MKYVDVLVPYCQRIYHNTDESTELSVFFFSDYIIGVK